MDNKLKDALDLSNYMTTLNNQKRLLNEQYSDNIIYYFNGGQFTLTHELICFCAMLVVKNITAQVLIDDNSTPIYVGDMPTFADDVLAKHTKASNTYLTGYTKLKNNRSVEGVIS